MITWTPDMRWMAIAGTAFGLVLYVIFGPDSTSSTWRKKKANKLAPKGLKNIGNTCFTNVILQSLASCPSFLSWLEDSVPNEESVQISVMREVLETIRTINNTQGSDQIESAFSVLNALKAKGWVTNSQEQDAHELFQILLTSIEEEFEKDQNLSKRFSELFEDDSEEFENGGIVSKVSGRKKSQIPVKKLSHPFIGTLANKLCYSSGKSKSPLSNVIFNSVTLTLPRVPKISNPLSSLLQSYVSKELIEGEGNQSFVKQSTFARLPRTLCFHIQRTSFQHGFPTKRCDTVGFPVNLDMSSYVYLSLLMKDRRFMQLNAVDEDLFDCFKLILYNLRAVIVHLGDINSGHYITYRRGIKDPNIWFKISDDVISAVDSNEVLNSQVYMLFYERVLGK